MLISLAQAGPIGLMAVGMAASLGAILGLRLGVVRYRAALLVAVTGMAFSPAGLWLARRIDNRWLAVLFASTLLYVAFNTLRKARGKTAPATPVRPVCVRASDSGRFTWTRPCARALALSGAVAGLLSGMLGGRSLSGRLSGPHLQVAFAAVSAIVAGGMIAKALS